MNQARSLVRIRSLGTTLGQIQSRTIWCQARRNFHSTAAVRQKEERMDEPIKYSGSPAKNWEAYKTFLAPQRDRPSYQPLSVVLSFSIFMIYFCVLREENDLDEAIGKTLYTRIPGLEESQILQTIEYNKVHGLSTASLEARLKELREE